MSLKIDFKQFENQYIPYIVCDNNKLIVESKLEDLFLESLELNIEKCPNVSMELCFYLEKIKRLIVEKWR